jgi:hypothetical protein
MYRQSSKDRTRLFAKLLGVWTFIMAVVLLTAGSCGTSPPTTSEFSLSLDKNTITIPQGASGTVEVSVNATGGFDDDVTFSVSGQPTGVETIFAPTSSKDKTTLTINVLGSASVGSSTLTINGVSGDKQDTADDLNLTISAAVDTTAPTIVSTVPANSASGVLATDTIVITFSEPMNKLVTQNAYQSATAGILSSQVVFTWNAAGTVLTIDPNADLTINAGADPAVVTAAPYAYQITNVATDLAGNPLSTASFSFTTQRRITQNLPGIATLTEEVRADGVVDGCGLICIGDSGDAANAQYKAFFGFDITGIPEGIQSFEFANLSLNQVQVLGTPYADLGGTLLAEHVNVETLNLAAFNLAAIRSLGTISTDATLEYKTLDVLTALEEDYAQRTTRGNRTQYRLIFPIVSNFDAIFDGARFADIDVPTPSILQVEYLLP